MIKKYLKDPLNNYSYKHNNFYSRLYFFWNYCFYSYNNRCYYHRKSY